MNMWEAHVQDFDSLDIAAERQIIATREPKTLEAPGRSVAPSSSEARLPNR